MPDRRQNEFGEAEARLQAPEDFQSHRPVTRHQGRSTVRTSSHPELHSTPGLTNDTV